MPVNSLIEFDAMPEYLSVAAMSKEETWYEVEAVPKVDINLFKGSDAGRSFAPP